MNTGQKRKLQIAIDGPAGAGKSTVAKKVAEKLGIYYLDTGAMYRAVAHEVLRLGIPLENEKEVTKIAENTRISFDYSNNEAVFCNGKNVTTEIRSPEVTKAVSVIAAYPGVRNHLVKLQRQEAAKGNVVMDGRDIGTHVLPQAAVKIFLTASLEERAKRRFLEMLEKGKISSPEKVLEDIAKRDRYDSEREFAPLRPAKDALVIDTTGLTVEEVVDKIVSIVREV